MFTTDGLIQIGGSMVPRRVISSVCFSTIVEHQVTSYFDLIDTCNCLSFALFVLHSLPLVTVVVKPYLSQSIMFACVRTKLRLRFHFYILNEGKKKCSSTGCFVICITPPLTLVFLWSSYNILFLSVRTSKGLPKIPKNLNVFRKVTTWIQSRNFAWAHFLILQPRM